MCRAPRAPPEPDSDRRAQPLPGSRPCRRPHMAIDVGELRPGPSTPSSPRSSTSSRTASAEYLAGEIDEDVFRVFRLNQGIYGQRQGGHNQMVRVKVPYGRSSPSSSRCSATSPRRTRAAGRHLTTRQNVQLHFVQLEQTPEVLRLLASVGLTQPRGVRRHRPQRHGLPPRRRLPVRGARHQPVGRRPPPTSSCATRTRSGCRASSRSTSRAASPTAARRCSTTSA